MITLYGSHAGFGLPEVSPYVTKTEVQLMMAGLPYRKAPAAPATGPKGQIPYIDDDGQVVGDSTFIRLHLERTYGVDLDDGLDALDRARAWAVERMIENHLTWAMLNGRWLTPENFEKGPARFFDHLPEEARAPARAQALDRVRAAQHAVGVGRHSPDEIVELGERSLAALATLLGDAPFLFGERPCGADATAFGSLAGLLTPYFDSALRERAFRYDALPAYVDRMMARFYPDHPWASSHAAPARPSGGRPVIPSSPTDGAGA
jgi:glutathione S-transferase